VSNSDDRKTSATVSVRKAVNSTVIGVLNETSPEQMDAILSGVRALEGKVETLLSIPSTGAELRSDHAGADALYVCESPGAMAIGFAANHSGLLVCPASLGEVKSATHITSGTEYRANVNDRQLVLQSARITAATHGLVPAYWDWREGPPSPDEPLWVFGIHGQRCQARLSGFAFDNLRVISSVDEELILNGVFEASYESKEALIGGPILTSRNEVLGIGVANAPEAGRLYGQPWAQLDRCIEMDALATPRLAP
jgi:hypothetical protein